MSVMTINPTKLDEFVGKALGDIAAGYAGVMVSLGHRLGLYAVMAGAGPLNATEVARRSGCAERYVREWLNGQAAGGYVLYHPSSRTYELTAEQAAVLADPESPVFLPPAWDVPASMWFDQERSLEAFRSGKGIPWGDHDARLFRGSAAFYRNSYRAQLSKDWIPALDGVEARLRAGIQVADVGCGHGHSTVLMAEAFPSSRFTGFDVHPDSLLAARANAKEAGVLERVCFDAANATGYPGRYDLICFFDCLHDMGDPVAAVRHAAEALAEGGSLMVVEPWAGDRVEDNLNPVGRIYYAASTVICCAHALSEDGGLSLGAQAGPARLTEVLCAGGFRTVRIAHKTPFNMVLEARR